MPFTDRLQLAVAAYLARFTGSSRGHTASDLRCFLAGARSAAWTADGAGRWIETASGPPHYIPPDHPRVVGYRNSGPPDIA